MRLDVGDATFRRKQNRRGKPTTEGRVAYHGPLDAPGTPKIKIDLTSDEVLASAPELRDVHHPYGDGPEQPIRVRCYALTELFAEKIRALAERCRPRDLYDVVHVFRRFSGQLSAQAVSAALHAKCSFVGIAPPEYETIRKAAAAGDLEESWASMLTHQLPALPALDAFWDDLREMFEWLATSRAPRALPRAELARDDLSSWVPSPRMARWGKGAPLEVVRFAGANRLRVELDYRPKAGRTGWRTCEPYSLRSTRTGHRILYVLNDRRELRGYRVDRIANARATGQTFVPAFHVEF